MCWCGCNAYRMQRLLIVPEVVRNCAPSRRRLNSADADADRSERISSPNFFELRHPVEWRSIDGVEQTASSVALTLRSLIILCRVQNILVPRASHFQPRPRPRTTHPSQPSPFPQLRHTRNIAPCAVSAQIGDAQCCVKRHVDFGAS